MKDETQKIDEHIRESLQTQLQQAPAAHEDSWQQLEAQLEEKEAWWVPFFKASPALAYYALLISMSSYYAPRVDVTHDNGTEDFVVETYLDAYDSLKEFDSDNVWYLE